MRNPLGTKTYRGGIGADGQPFVSEQSKPTRAQRQSLQEIPWTPGPQTRGQRIRRALVGWPMPGARSTVSTRPPTALRSSTPQAFRPPRTAGCSPLRPQLCTGRLPVKGRRSSLAALRDRVPLGKILRLCALDREPPRPVRGADCGDG
jgi:hypothetical protein